MCIIFHEYFLMWQILLLNWVLRMSSLLSSNDSRFGSNHFIMVTFPTAFDKCLSIALCMCVCVRVHTQLCTTLGKPLGCGLPGSSVHEIVSARVLNGLPFPTSGDLPDPGIELASPALAIGLFTTAPLGKPCLGVTYLVCSVRLRIGGLFPSTGFLLLLH